MRGIHGHAVDNYCRVGSVCYFPLIESKESVQTRKAMRKKDVNERRREYKAFLPQARPTDKLAQGSQVARW